jgi:hypothetical protein
MIRIIPRGTDFTYIDQEKYAEEITNTISVFSKSMSFLKITDRFCIERERLRNYLRRDGALHLQRIYQLNRKTRAESHALEDILKDTIEISIDSVTYALKDKTYVLQSVPLNTLCKVQYKDAITNTIELLSCAHSLTKIAEMYNMTHSSLRTLIYRTSRLKKIYQKNESSRKRARAERTERNAMKNFLQARTSKVRSSKVTHTRKKTTATAKKKTVGILTEEQEIEQKMQELREVHRRKKIELEKEYEYN